jgi:pyruvate,water dikinase
MTELDLILLNRYDSLARIGNKAENLVLLSNIHGLKVPKTWVLPWDWYQCYLSGENNLQEQLLSAVEKHLDFSKAYAVRSSSNIEDMSFHSFAGLFKSVINVRGFQNILDAVVEVWDSVQSETVNHYLEALSITPDDLHMAVIIQEMVSPVFSGVLFSNNPMTGVHEIVIEAVSGEGTALVQDGVTPSRWISRHDRWVAKPDQPKMPVEIADQVLEKSKSIIGHVKNPIDLEWVWDGQDVYWVQMREITSLKELVVYSNRFSKDMMPGMIHPLIWSINVPLINAVWLEILEEIVGELPIEAEDLAKSFFYRSYFNMSAIGQVFTRVGFPSEGLEMMMGLLPVEEGRPVFKPTAKMVKLFPKLIRFINDKWRFEKKIRSELPFLESCLELFSPYPDPKISLADQIDEIKSLYDLVQKIVYFNVLTPILATMYTRMLEGQLKKTKVNLLEFDLLENLDEINRYQPNVALEKLHQSLESLGNHGMRSSELIDGEINIDDIKGTEFEKAFELFVEDFGHLSDNSNNFMAVPWRENPEMVLKMVCDTQIAGKGKGKRICFSDLPVKGLNKIFLTLFYKRARKFALYREQISKNYVYGYGLFRPYFVRLADGLIDAGWMDSRNDIFYLNWSEIQQLIEDSDPSLIHEKINTRKKEMDAYKDVVLPDIIYGDDPPPAYSSSMGKLTGTPTSQGYYSGLVKIISGREDFDKVNPGDIIVIPFSDVGWTPLFVRAGAVIAESGGLLSHSSIIAREYQIPAVVSVSGCMKLKDDQQVSVNGFTGEIILLDTNT